MIVNEPEENYKTGWVKLFRSIRKHWIWKDPIKLKWWIDILLEVNHSGQKVPIGYEIFECNRGQSIKSLKNWGEDWNVSKDKARNFLRMLEKDNMITLENLSKTTRLTVCNYDSYQDILHDNQTQSKRNPNAIQTRPHPNNNDKNKKNGNNDKKLYFDDFYLKEISENESAPLIDKYKSFYTFISGEDALCDMGKIRDIKSQLKYDSFAAIYSKAGKDIKLIGNLIRAIANYDKRNYKSLVGALNTFLNNELKK